MRKISLILFLAILITAVLPTSQVMAEDRGANAEYIRIITDTEGLLEALNINYNKTNDTSSEVTRRDYATIIMKLLGAKGNANATVHGFSDVDEGELNFMLGQAINAGIISKADSFNPDRAISYAEAFKMAVVALGYANEAYLSGGYPTGYIAAATKLKLTQGIEFDINSPISYGSMMVLVSNFVNTDIRKQTGFGDTSEYRVEKNHTVLTEYYNLKKLSGVIEGDAVSSLYDKSLKAPAGYITLAGENYIYSGDYTLGTRVTAYATTNEKHNRIAYMKLEDTKTINLYPADNPVLSGNVLSYGDEELKVSAHVAVIYNGQAYMAYSEDDISIKSGSLILIDNDNNNAIDVIHINESEIFIASEINLSDRIIFVSGGSRVIELDTEDIPCRILLNGEISQLKSIPKDAVLSCYYTKDGIPVTLSASTKTVSGVLTEVATSEQQLYVDGVKYYYNEYFKENSLSKMTIGANTVFMLDSNGYITSTNLTVTDMQYGYLVGLEKSAGIGGRAMAKIFTQSGSVKIHNLAQKVRVDAQSTMSAEDAIGLSCFKNDDGSFKEQLIRYSVNANDEVSIVDTEFGRHDHSNGSATTGFYEKNADAYDSLRRYSYPGYDTTATLAYKTTGVMVPYFYLSAYTPVLVVNADKTLSDEDRFSVTTRAMFIKDLRYRCKNMQVYNVKEDGGAEIMVYIDEVGSGSSALDTESAYGIVESFNQAIIPATGETGYRLSLFDGSTFKDLYVKDISMLESLYTGNDKENGELPLSPGDFIRYTADARSIVRSVAKDFDESNKRVLNYATTGDNSTMRYDYGKVYAKSSASMLMISTSDKTADITNGTADLKCINVTNIGVIYDSATKKVSPASYSDIIPYVYSPDMCSTVFIRNRYALGYMFVIYK